MLIIIALATTAALIFQMSHVATAVAWAATHGAFSMRELALVAIPFAVLWGGWGIARLQRPARGRASLLALSALLLLTTELVLPVTPMRARALQAAVENTSVRDVADEAIVSELGGPMGVRLTYVVRFPRAGVYSVGPSVASPTRDPPDAMAAAFHLGFTREPASSPEPERTEEPGARWYVADLDYRFTADLHPSFLRTDAAGARCIFVQPNRNYSENDFLSVVTRGWRSSYRLEMLVDGGSTTSRRLAQRYVTAREYDVAEFYESLLADGVTSCPS